MKNRLTILAFVSFAMLTCVRATGQSYPVKVQVQLVQPFYPYLSDYKQKSIISFTNTADVPMDIYIQAKLENDRGQVIQTAPNHYSRIPIHLPALQTVVVQGFQLDTSFFDLHNLQTNLDDRTKARLYQFGMIPEGFYSYCITAFRVDGNGNYARVSDPNGSCAFVNVGYIQPPQLLSPAPGDNIPANPVQNINITWTRPVGNLQGAALLYNLYLVKVPEGQNPELAMSHAVRYGAGIFIKVENIPATTYRFNKLTNFPLEEGSKYALLVQSKDLNGKAAFINNGRSETSIFTYGSMHIAGHPDDNSSNPKKDGDDIDVIKGKLQWAFKNSEQGTVYQYTHTGKLTLPPPPAGKKTPATIKTTASGLKMSAITNVAKPFYKFIPEFVINADPTTISLTEKKNTSTPLKSKQVELSAAKAKINAVDQIHNINYLQLVDAFTATAADSTCSENKTITADTGSQRFPLAGVNVTLSGIATGSPGKKVLLGTGTTADDGRFTIHFLDPGFQNNGRFTRLILSVQASDFENTVFDMAVPAGDLSGQLDIGTKVLLARTWRFFPKISYERSDATDIGKCEVHIYREAADYRGRPWLKEEGRTSGKGREKQVIAGKEVIEIASLNIQQLTPLQLMTKMATRSGSGEGVGRIFYGGKLLVKIIPASESYRGITSRITAFNKSLPRNRVMTGEAIYRLRALPSHLEGNISLFLAEQTSVPVSGAAVRVMYRKADVISAPPGIPEVLENAQVSKTPLYGNYSGLQLTGNNLQKVNTKLTGPTPALMVVSQKNNGPSPEPAYSIKPVMAVAKDQAAARPSPVCDGCAYKTGYTDAVGNYYIGNLPVLNPKAKFIIEVVKLPPGFRKFKVLNKSGQAYPAEVSLGKGVSKHLDFMLNAEVVDVGGRVVDKAGKGLPGVRLIFKGNTLTTSGMDGLFVFKLYPGDHSITLEKEGYLQKDVALHIPVADNDHKKSHKKVPKWLHINTSEKNQATLSRIKEIPTVQAALSAGYKFSPALFGLPEDNGTRTAYELTTYNAGIVSAFGVPVAAFNNAQYEQPRGTAVDMKDIGYLEKITGKIRFTVKDRETNAPLGNVQISLFDTAQVTDAGGQWYYEGFGGATVITIMPPASSGYVAEQRSLTLPENGEVREVTVLLEKGIKISGQVKSGNTPLVNARVFADKGDLSATTTDNTGHYILYLKKGTHDLSARLQNYVGRDLVQRSIPEDGTVYNFDLQGGNGKNYGKLLGFDVELSKVTASGSGETWSGNFIHLEPGDPAAFVLPEKMMIPFSNVKVRFDADGNAIPAGGKVESDITNIPLKLFGYLPAAFSNGDVITITDAGDNKGQLKGTVNIRFNAIQGYRGWQVPGDVKVLMARSGAPSNNILLMQADGSMPAESGSWTLVTETGKPFDAQLYGFKIHLNSDAAVSEKGFEFSGSISTPALSVIKSIDIGIKSFRLNRSLAVSGVQIESNDLPKLGIAGWQASFSSIIFNQDGFKIGGRLSIAIPVSGTSEIDFSDLSMAKDEIFGGKFLIPETGINLLSVANLNTGGAPLSFGRVGGSDVYRIGGKASLKINLSLFSKEFKIPTFEVLTNGAFNLQAPVGYATSLGPFGFSIQNLYINTTAGTPYIGIQGGFRTDLDFIRFDMADIKVKAGTAGPVYTIEKIGVTLDVPVVKISALVAFRENGFEGDGSLSIPATPVSGSVSFHYFKKGGSVDLGAHFSANIPPVPIGAIVTLERVGGGFDYSSGNFKVDINGKLSLLGTGAVVALDPLGLTVGSRGILTGYGDVAIADYLKTAHAETIFNGPEKTFTVQVSAQMSPLKGLLQQQVKGALVISAKPGDEYAFLGCGVQVQIAGLVNNHGEMAIAIGLKNPKNHDPLTAPYFAYAPEEYMQNTFSGVYINVAAQLGIPRDHPLGFDITIASAKVWCSSAFQAGLILNFAEGAYRIRFGGKFDAGFEACVADIACVGLSAGLCYVVEGGRNDALGWNFRATATGNVSCGFGIGIGDCNPGCNEVVTFWDGCIGGAFKVCAGAALDFGFSENQGLKFNVHGADNVAPCF